MPATVLVQSGAFVLYADDRQMGAPRALDGEANDFLDGLASKYRRLEHSADDCQAIEVGRALFQWLDGGERQLHRLLEQAQRPLRLTIHCPGRNPGTAEWALLQAPWELLADGGGFLAGDALLQFSPVRQLGPAGAVPPLDRYRLGLAFMAASPEGQSELDYEAEETAILDAVGGTNLDLLVDESGEARALARHLVAAGCPPVLHLSCHGHNAWREKPDQPPRAVLLLEDGQFGPQPTDAPSLLTALRPAGPRLIFLSACLSAAGQGPGDKASLPPAADSKDAGAASEATDTRTPAQSLASALILAGMPAVLGWDGSVADVAATRFAAEFYRRLADREGLALAVAQARRGLFNAPDAALRRNWHLARLWVGSSGDGALPLVGGGDARSLLPPDYGQEAFLGKEVPVASHARFVGRRRELQRALRVLDAGQRVGLLLTGMGRLGKSSLAARIANRRREDFTLVVVHGRFSAHDVVDKLDEALADNRSAREQIRAARKDLLDAARNGAEAAGQVLGDLLTDLLRGPCQKRSPETSPLLLVLDDFEQLLEETAGVRPVLASHAALVATLLRPFRPSITQSRVLITSRFPFSLAVGQEDLAFRFDRIELASFNETAERKLTLRHRAAAHNQYLADLEQREALLPRARTAARGNPGLLELLSGRLVLNPAVPLAQAETALEQMEVYLAKGALPATEALREQLQAIAVSTLLNLAGSAGQALLRAMTMFHLPVPRSIGEVLAANLGGRLQTLIDLALIEPGQDPVLAPQPAIRASPLAASQLAPLTDEERSALAGVGVKPLFEAWGGKGAGRAGHAELQLAQLAVAAGDGEVAAACGATAVRTLEGASYHAAADFASALLALLAETGQAPPPLLVAHAARVIGATGKGALVDHLLAKAVTDIGEEMEGLSPMEAGHLFLELANRQFRSGKLDDAERHFGKAADCAKAANQPLSVAVARGCIADILQARGQFDEALRIYQEVLPAFERLGDVRSKAVTMGYIADILQARGQLDEALRIRQEEQLPVYERLGDVYAKAVTMRKIADILQARGELDQALVLLRDHCLPAVQGLGAIRDIAVFQGRIADILQARGQLDEALRIRQEEELPVYERLADVRSLLVGRANTALILMERKNDGDREEANTLLCLALADALRLGIPEAGQIEQILQHFDLACGDEPKR